MPRDKVSSTVEINFELLNVYATWQVILTSSKIFGCIKHLIYSLLIRKNISVENDLSLNLYIARKE